MKKKIKIGSAITFLDSVDSTNNYTANLINEKKITNGQVIMADYQGEGRGQRGSKWYSESGKNILLSLYLELDNLSVKNQSILAKYTSVSLVEALRTIGLNPQIKWPNDVLIDNKKICGVLIENQLIGQSIKNSIIGIGLNVNQETFELENVTSLKIELGKEQDRMSILFLLISAFNRTIDMLLYHPDYIEEYYHKSLFKLNEVARFYNVNLGGFQGVITGVDSSGMIQITTNKGKFTFDTKEIKFC